MKKYGMIFASVILVLATLLIPNQKVRAEDIYSINYENFDSAYINIKDNLEEARIFLEQYSEDYYYIINFDEQSRIDLHILKKFDTKLIMYMSGVGGSLASYGFQNVSDNNKRNYYQIKDITIDNFDLNFSEFKTKVENGSFNYSNGAYIESYIINWDSDPKGVIYATNMNFVVNDTSLYNLYSFNINGTSYQPGETINTYYNYINSNKIINISSNFACDLEGKDSEYVTIDFSDYQNENYVYQYGIKRQINSDIVWYDIELSNGIYNFNEYYNNTIIYARVLDNLGNEVSINEYRINNDELPKFGLIISSSLGCPIPNYDGDPQAEIINVDFINAYNENYKYYYYYDSKSKYEINLTSDNLVYQIFEYLYQFIYFEILDENDNLIYFYYNDVSSSDRLGFIPYDYENRHNIIYSVNPSCDLQNNNILVVNFNFSDITKYVNHYNFDVVINGNHFGSIQHYEFFLNEENYIDNLNYEVKIYIDDYLYLSRNYSVGDVSSSFDDMYDDILNDFTSSDIDDNESLFNLFINSLNHFKDVIIDIFDSCTYFFNNLDSTLKYFYVSIFILILFEFLIKFIL